MDFHDLLLGIDWHRQQGQALTPKEFLEYAKRHIDTQNFGAEQKGVNYSRFIAEDAWIASGKPYFKIWPDVIPLLTDVSVDVPASFLRVPFDAFLLRLPKLDNGLAVDAQHHVKSILVIEGDNREQNRLVVLHIDIGEVEPSGIPVLHWATLNCDGGETIEAAFGAGIISEMTGLQISDDIRQRCLRLAVSICFLATGMDRLIEADILSKDLAAYLEAQRKNESDKVRATEERAVRRGKKGWNVGRQERLRPLVRRDSEDDGEAVSRSPLRHQFQRRAHFRVTPTGTVVFVRQATVRPDLPPPERPPGYGLK